MGTSLSHKSLARQGFDLDLQFGQIAEQQVRGILTGENGFKCEVKRDAKAIETGNVAIEFMCNGKPSGLAVTTAPYWWIHLDGMRRGIIFEVDELKTIVKRVAHNSPERIVRGGDYNLSIMVLVPLQELVRV